MKVKTSGFSFIASVLVQLLAEENFIIVLREVQKIDGRLVLRVVEDRAYDLQARGDAAARRQHGELVKFVGQVLETSTRPLEAHLVTYKR